MSDGAASHVSGDVSTPAAAGMSMPPEWERHERTIICWPARAEAWRGPGGLDQARRDYATIIDAVARFEPVLLVVDPSQEAEARAAVTGDAEVAAIPIDDSWVRDSGPIFVRDEAGNRAGVSFRFNGWGEKFAPWDDDDALAGRLVGRLGDPLLQAPIVLEGGSIHVDGTGALITTEQCLLEPHRNPELGKDEIEAALRAWLGVERVVWLGRGLVEDADTDGHVDNICAPLGPGRVLLQTVTDEANPNFEHCEENRLRLEAAGFEVVSMPHLPYATPDTVVPYTNFYVANGAVIVPTIGAESDGEALRLLGELHPGREVVPVPGATLAHGGGGVHCITQQIPAV
jgi:agmatine deiminase